MQTSAELDVAEAPLCTGSDRELISRFLAARDEEAFAEIVTRYRRLVMRVAQSTLRDWHAAEDAFGELAKLLTGVSTRTLTRQLRELEDCGVIARVVHRQIPPKVEYSLTPLGLKLKPVLSAMHDWGQEAEKVRFRRSG